MRFTVLVQLYAVVSLCKPTCCPVRRTTPVQDVGCLFRSRTAKKLTWEPHSVLGLLANLKVLLSNVNDTKHNDKSHIAFLDHYRPEHASSCSSSLSVLASDTTPVPRSSRRVFLLCVLRDGCPSYVPFLTALDGFWIAFNLPRRCQAHQTRRFLTSRSSPSLDSL